MNKKEEFVKKHIKDALLVEMVTGFPARMLLAQAALETGWGQHIQGHNLFGIKDTSFFPGYTKMTTTEYVKDKKGRVVASFETFPSFLHSMMYYISLIKNNPRYQYAWLMYKYKPKEYYTELQKGGYATDPDYGEKCYNVYLSIEDGWIIES
ncbi:MAG: peptidoglycan hydrolase FlgJ [Kosmotogales bacterium]|nr:peptidoglycan hydrolase FlgJ [Kosmotogales bacterium]